MFTCLDKYTYKAVTVYAVDPARNRFLVNWYGNFEWQPMDDFVPL